MNMDCIFCKIINGDIPSYTVYEDEYVKCFLDIDPESNGHTLIIPKKHFQNIKDIELDYITKVFEAAKKVVKLLDDAFNPDGYRLTQNNGNIQDVLHYHLHVIPTYKTKQDKLNLEEVYNKIIVK